MGSLFGRMERRVALAVVRAGKALAATGPVTDKRTFFCMRSQVASEIEPSGKRAPTSWNGAFEHCFVLPPRRASGLSGRGRNMLLFYLEDRGETHGPVLTTPVGTTTVRLW